MTLHLGQVSGCAATGIDPGLIGPADLVSGCLVRRAKTGSRCAVS